MTVVECHLIYICLMCFHDWDEVNKARLPQRDNISLLMVPEPGMHTDYVKLKGLGKLRTAGFPTR